MRSHHGPRDPAGLAMLAGALLGFVVGAVVGLGDAGLATPVVLPFVGALCGVVAAALPFLFTGARRHRAELRALEASHDELRAAAHDGWIEDVDLSEARRRR